MDRQDKQDYFVYWERFSGSGKSVRSRYKILFILSIYVNSRLISRICYNGEHHRKTSRRLHQQARYELEKRGDRAPACPSRPFSGANFRAGIGLPLYLSAHPELVEGWQRYRQPAPYPGSSRCCALLLAIMPAQA